MALVSGTSKVEVISQALTLLGNDRPTNDLNDNPRIVAAADMYNRILYDCLTQRYWRFSLSTAQLSQLVSTPTNTYWQYQYLLPSNYLQMLRVYKNGNRGSFFDYQIFGDKIFTNLDNDLYADYTLDPGPSNYPAYFVSYLVYKVAAEISMTITQNFQVAEYWQGIVKKYFLQAAYRDSQIMPNIPIQRNDIYSTHFGY